MGNADGLVKTKDFVKELGYLSLGTRLKRLGERLQAQTQVVLERADIEVPSSHFPLLLAVDRLGAPNVGELAEALGTSQPGVTRMLEKLVADGWLESTQSAADRRVRTIETTKAGRQLIARARRTVFAVVEAAVADACAGSPHALLPALVALEDALAQAPLSVRAERSSAGGKKHASA